MQDESSTLQLVLCGQACVTPAYQRWGLAGDRSVCSPKTHGPRAALPKEQHFPPTHEPIFLLWQVHLNFTGHFLTKNDELS